jgi:hypothetical protein
LLTGIFCGNGNVTTAISEIFTGENASEVSTTVTARRNAALCTGNDTVIVALHDEVDNTGHSVGTVNSRVTAGDDVDTVDQIGRDRVDVEAVVAWCRGDVTTTVYENQRTVRTQTTKVEKAKTGGADETARVTRAEG